MTFLNPIESDNSPLSCQAVNANYSELQLENLSTYNAVQGFTLFVTSLLCGLVAITLYSSHRNKFPLKQRGDFVFVMVVQFAIVAGMFRVSFSAWYNPTLIPCAFQPILRLIHLPLLLSGCAVRVSLCKNRLALALAKQKVREKPRKSTSGLTELQKQQLDEFNDSNLTYTKDDVTLEHDDETTTVHDNTITEQPNFARNKDCDLISNNDEANKVREASKGDETSKRDEANKGDEASKGDEANKDDETSKGDETRKGAEASKGDTKLPIKTVLEHNSSTRPRNSSLTLSECRKVSIPRPSHSASAQERASVVGTMRTTAMVPSMNRLLSPSRRRSTQANVKRFRHFVMKRKEAASSGRAWALLASLIGPWFLYTFYELSSQRNIGCYGCRASQITQVAEMMYVIAAVCICVVSSSRLKYFAKASRDRDSFGTLSELRKVSKVLLIGTCTWLVLSLSDPLDLMENGTTSWDFVWMVIGILIQFETGINAYWRTRVFRTQRTAVQPIDGSIGSLTLEEVLEDADWYEMFLTFCTTEHASEAVRFFNRCRRFLEKYPTLEASKQWKEANTIFAVFIEPGSALEINISDSNRQKLEDIFHNRNEAQPQTKPCPKDLFEPALRELLKNLKQDSFQRFKASLVAQQASKKK